MAPKLTAAEYSFFERVAEAARRADLEALGRLIALAPSPRLRGHAFAAAAIHHAKRHKNRRIAMRLLKKAVALWIDDYKWIGGVPLIRDCIEYALSNRDFPTEIFGDD